MANWTKIEFESSFCYLINKSFNTLIKAFEIDGVYYGAEYISHPGVKAPNVVENNNGGASIWFNYHQHYTKHTTTEIIGTPKVLYPQQIAFRQSDDLDMNYDYLSVLLSLGDGRTETERFGARYSNSHASSQIKILKKEPEKRVFMRLEAWNNYVRRIHTDFYSERMCAHFGNEYLFQLKEFQVMEFLEVEIIGACKTRTRTIHTSGEKNKFMIYRSPDCDPILIKKT